MKIPDITQEFAGRVAVVTGGGSGMWLGKSVCTDERVNA